MAVHHKRCPLVSLPDTDCGYCEDLRGAENDVRRELNDTWQHALRENEKRAYARGWQDGANGRPAAP